MTSLFSILLPLFGVLALLAALDALQTAGEKMQNSDLRLVSWLGKALAVTALTALTLASIAVFAYVGYMVTRPSSFEPPACAHFCD